MTPTSAKDPDALGSKTLSIALIGPEEFRRQPIASALAESARRRNPGVLFLSRTG